MRASLAELEAVAAVARHGGFRAAARALGLSSSALSHAVAALEERLAVRLFNRTTRSVSLSAAGERLVAQITPALAAIDNALDHADDDAAIPSGRLRLNMAPGAARMMMAPIILEYARRYPQVEIEIVTENALVDIVGQGFDAGVRLADTIPSDMIAVPVFPTLRSIVAGTPAYFSGREPPRMPADLRRHQCIRYRLQSGTIYRWEFQRRGEAVLIDPPGTLILDDSDLLLGATLEGAGLGYLEERSAAPHIAAGRLVPVLDAWCPRYPGLSLYFDKRRHMPMKLRALVDLIKARPAGDRKPSIELPVPTA